ncbi:hypothetical protein PS3A_17880 [Pseudomonas sp. 3A(2025)]
MLSKEDQEFISEKMKIVLNSITFKLSERALSPYKTHLEHAISHFIRSIIDQNNSNHTYNANSLEQSPAQAEINNFSLELSKKLNNTEALTTLDSLRHTFASFACNGHHHLFTLQENESWHPKIILDEELKPNDINELPEIITLYRGTDIIEYTSSNYGQSWTTRKEIAELFAFKHYKDQPEFDINKRAILRTTISKKHVYFSNQSGEFEVVIDTRKISHVIKVG